MVKGVVKYNVGDNVRVLDRVFGLQDIGSCKEVCAYDERGEDMVDYVGRDICLFCDDDDDIGVQDGFEADKCDVGERVRSVWELGRLEKEFSPFDKIWSL